MAALALGRGQAKKRVPQAWTPEIIGSGPRLQEGCSSLTSPLPGADVGHPGRLAWLQIRGWEGQAGYVFEWRGNLSVTKWVQLSENNPSPHPEYSPPPCGWHLLPSQPLTSRLLPLFLPLLSLPPAYP